MHLEKTSAHTNPPTVIFREVEKMFYPPTLNLICFVEKNNIFLRFFESDTVKVIALSRFFRKIMKYLKF